MTNGASGSGCVGIATHVRAVLDAGGVNVAGAYRGVCEQALRRVREHVLTIPTKGKGKGKGKAQQNGPTFDWVAYGLRLVAIYRSGYTHYPDQTGDTFVSPEQMNTAFRDRLVPVEATEDNIIVARHTARVAAAWLVACALKRFCARARRSHSPAIDYGSTAARKEWKLKVYRNDNVNKELALVQKHGNDPDAGHEIAIRGAVELAAHIVTALPNDDAARRSVECVLARLNDLTWRMDLSNYGHARSSLNKRYFADLFQLIREKRAQRKAFRQELQEVNGFKDCSSGYAKWEDPKLSGSKPKPKPPGPGSGPGGPKPKPKRSGTQPPPPPGLYRRR